MVPTLASAHLLMGNSLRVRPNHIDACAAFGTFAFDFTCAENKPLSKCHMILSKLWLKTQNLNDKINTITTKGNWSNSQGNFEVQESSEDPGGWDLHECVG